MAKRFLFSTLIFILLLSGSAMALDNPYIEQIDARRETPQSLLFGINMVANPHILYYPKGYDESVYTTLQRIGGTMVRLCSSPRDIEPVHGKRDWSRIEGELDRALRHGMEPMMLICNTPTWALPVEQIPGYDEVRDLPEKERTEWLGKFTHQYPYRTDLFPEFADFCRDMAARFKGKVHLYQLWNEPNGCSWHFHDGYNHADEYVPFLAVAYKAIKEVDPDAMLLMGSLDDKDGYGHIFLNMYYDIRDREYGGKRLCDGVTFHPYDEDIPHKKWKIKRLRDIMVKNGDADLPMFITEYGWRTGDSRDYKKREWLRQTLEMYQDPDLEFLKGAIHLALSDFEGEPGFGLMNENLRPRESFYVFQGTPRFGASPPHTIHWKPLGDGKIEITWKTVLPVDASLILRGAREGESVAGPGKYAQSTGTEHKVMLEGLEPGRKYSFRIQTDTIEGGETYSTPSYPVRIPGPEIQNGDFNAPFFAGIAEGWRIDGSGLATDAGVFPGIEMPEGEHGQVLFAVPERKIGLNASALTWIESEPGTTCEVTVSAADASLESDGLTMIRLGVDPAGGEARNADSIVWTEWQPLRREWRDVTVQAPADGHLMTIFVEAKATGGREKSRPAVAFDEVEVRNVEGS
jgi:hypothetical protein